MSAKQEHRKRLIAKNQRLEAENERLAELLLLHEPPCICKLKSKICKSPSRLFTCGLGVHNNPEKCIDCRENVSKLFSIGFYVGHDDLSYCQALLKYLIGSGNNGS